MKLVILFLFISISCFGQSSNSFSDHVEKNKYEKQHIENIDVQLSYDNQELSLESTSVMHQSSSKDMVTLEVSSGRNGKKNKAIYIAIALVTLTLATYSLAKAL